MIIMKRKDKTGASLWHMRNGGWTQNLIILSLMLSGHYATSQATSFIIFQYFIDKTIIFLTIP